LIIDSNKETRRVRIAAGNIRRFLKAFLIISRFQEKRFPRRMLIAEREKRMAREKN